MGYVPIHEGQYQPVQLQSREARKDTGRAQGVEQELQRQFWSGLTFSFPNMSWKPPKNRSPHRSPVVNHPAYPVARQAAARTCFHFERHVSSSAAPQGGNASEVPDAAAVEAMIEAAFWPGLRLEEGYIARISLAFVAPEAVRQPLRFERQLPLAAQPLTRLAPAVERPGIHLGVWRDSGQFVVWGATRNVPPFCLVLEVIAHGLLVVKHSRHESEKFANPAVLRGDEIKVIDESFTHLPDCPDLLASLLGDDPQRASSESVNLLIRLAISMRAHGRGGSLLVVPAETQLWRESVAWPVLYSVVPPFTALAELIHNRDARSTDRHWADALRSAVGAVAGLTAVDGAAVISDQYEVLAF
jgi:hypothetical protein